MGFDRGPRVVFWHVWREHEVDSKRTITDEAPNLCEFGPNLVRESTGRAVDTDPASVGDSGDGRDVVGKSEDRMFDAEPKTDRGTKS